MVAQNYRDIPLADMLAGEFGVGHFKLPNFYGTGQFLHGFEDRVMTPWRDALAAHGFTWDRCYPIIFISGRNSATVGRPIRDWRNSAMRMIGAARARRALAATIPTSCCPPCIGWPRWPSVGSWGPTRAPSMTHIWSASSTSSCSVSTAAAPAAAAWCSTGCSNWPSATRPCATKISSPAGAPGRRDPCHRPNEDGRQA